MQIERRFLKGGELRAKKEGSAGIEGVGSVYNEIYDNGWFKETIKPGAFDDVLASDPDVRCLFNHDPDNVLGRTKSKTLRIADSPSGLLYECDTDPNTRIGSDVRAMVERGDVDGCSISFQVGEQLWRDEFDASGNFVSTTREIVKFAALYDIGPVTFPAYEQTSVQARSAFWPGGVPEEISQHVKSLQARSAEDTGAPPAPTTARTRERRDGDCECDCEACAGGDCDNCDDPDCDDPNCMCAERALRLRARMTEVTL